MGGDDEAVNVLLVDDETGVELLQAIDEDQGTDEHTQGAAHELEDAYIRAKVRER